MRTFRANRPGTSICMTIFCALIALVLALGWSVNTKAASSEDYEATPPFLVRQVAPNVLIILDNSNSMDEDVDGNAVGSDAPNSRSEIARQAILSFIQDNWDTMRFGLMAYQQSNINPYYLHNSFYYCSYDPSTYDPSATPAPKDDTVNTKRYPNPVDPGHYIYYDQALPMYSDSNLGNAFAYSSNYNETVDPETGNYYWVYQSKTGTLDPPLGISKGGLGSYGYSTHWFDSHFVPTDEDYAAGFQYFGKQLSWVYVGRTWFSNSSPGHGYLHVPIDDSDDAHFQALQEKLGTSNFSTNPADHPNNDLDTPLRNAGLTPIAGTLESARLYFQGNLPPDQGGNAPSPIQYSCQKNFIILVTDGLPSVDKNGNPGDADSLLPEVVSEVTQLRSTSVAGFTDPFDIQTFVLGFAIPSELGSKLDDIAVAGGTDVNGHAYLAGDASELTQALKSIFIEILKRTSSGTAASVISNSRSGEGAIYQSIFYPEYKDTSGNKVEWAGQLHALLVDAHGNMREDTNGNHKLDLTDDRIIVFDNGLVDKYVDSNGNGQLDDSEAASPEETTTMEDIKFLWSSSPWLNEISNEEDITQQRSYSSLDHKRYIFTFADQDQDMIADPGEVQDFVCPSLPSSSDLTDTSKIFAYIQPYKPFNKPSYVSAISSNTSVYEDYLERQTQRIINYIRGWDQSQYSSSTSPSYTIPAFRSRQVDYDGDSTVETWRLGDIVHSTPTVVGRPSENYDLLYHDLSYAEFFRTYKRRRTVVYVGANDGMIHAFNGGFYDSASKAFLTQPLDDTGNPDTSYTAYDLGAELWAYVPYNLLPHLYWLTDPDYKHIYYCDLKTKVFDAKIFSSGVDPVTGINHPYGWGTLLVAGMRLGGGEIEADLNKEDGDSYNPDVDRKMRSAFVIFDITDPESPPAVLGEISFDHLGFTTCYPTVIMLRNKQVTVDGDGNTVISFSDPGKWYLLLGSGPANSNGEPDPTSFASVTSSQPGKIYLVDLVKLAQDHEIWTVDGSDSNTAKKGVYVFASLDTNTFISPPIAVDYDLDYNTDAVYFGTVSGSEGSWGGKLRRIVVDDQLNLADWDSDSVLLDLTPNPSGLSNGQPIVSAPALAIDPDDNRWVFFGTGRFYTTTDADNTDQQSYYGIKEPRSGQSWSWAEVSRGDLVDVSSADVYEDGSTVLNVLHVANWNDLSSEIEANAGWFLNFPDEKERNLGQATLLGDILTFTTYLPSLDPCEFGGDTNLYAGYYKTGTAYFEAVIGLGQTEYNGKKKVLRRTTLGKGLSITPNLHTGREEGSKAFVQTSTGAIEVTEQANPGMTKSGRVSWKQE